MNFFKVIFVIIHWLLVAKLLVQFAPRSQCKLKKWWKWKPNKCKIATNRHNISHSGALEHCRLKPTTYIAGKKVRVQAHERAAARKVSWGARRSVMNPNVGFQLQGLSGPVWQILEYLWGFRGYGPPISSQTSMDKHFWRPSHHTVDFGRPGHYSRHHSKPKWCWWPKCDALFLDHMVQIWDPTLGLITDLWAPRLTFLAHKGQMAFVTR